MNPLTVAVLCSVWRPGPVPRAAVSAAIAEPLINQTLVFGYEPTGLAVARPMPSTLYHKALKRNLPFTPRDYLSNGDKFSGQDSVARVHWRAHLALDAWACLKQARLAYPGAIIVWLENDAVLIPNAIGRAIRAAQSAGAAACYGSGRWYSGAGALCFVFSPAVNPAPHILAYHLVQPLDWILSDFSRGRWPVVPAVRHGFGGTHASTRILP